MLIIITVLMLNIWAIPADDLFSPNINILEKLEKMKIMETRMGYYFQTCFKNISTKNFKYTNSFKK